MKDFEKLFLLAVVGAIAYFLWNSNFGPHNGAAATADSAKQSDAPWWLVSAQGGVSASNTLPNNSAGQVGQLSIASGSSSASSHDGNGYGVIDPFYETVQF